MGLCRACAGVAGSTQAGCGIPAIGGAFAADLCAKLAMLMGVALAFGGALLAHPGAQLEQLGENAIVVACSPGTEAGCGLANVRAI